MSYAADQSESYRRVAYFVDGFLKEPSPLLPVEQPTKFEFVINLKTAKTDRPDDSAERVGAADKVIR